MGKVPGISSAITPVSGSPSSDALPSSGSRRGRFWWKILLVAVVVLPPIIEYLILYRQAFSVPYQDDYAVILAFVREYSQHPDWTAKAIDVLTKQTNDYKLAFAHLIIGCDFELTGHLNFLFFVVFGNLCLLPIAYLLWRTYRSCSTCLLAERLKEFLPISLMFFTLVYWETMDWSMAGLQNLPVILFSLLSVTLLVSAVSKSSGLGRALLASLSAVLAALSSANGFLLAPIGLLILIPRRAFGASALWCISFFIPVAIYLYHYVPYGYSVHVTQSTSWAAKVFYFFAFLGCAVMNRWVAALLGMSLCAVFALSIRLRFDRKHAVPFYFTLWVFATAVLVGGLRGAITSRYSVYSIFVFLFAYLFVIDILPSRVPQLTRKRLFVASVVCGVVFFVAGNAVGYRRLGERRALVLAGMQHYLTNPEVNSPMIDPNVLKVAPQEAELERIELNDAVRNHLVVLPSRGNLR
jgi:hypothetical protein